MQNLTEYFSSVVRETTVFERNGLSVIFATSPMKTIFNEVFEENRFHGWKPKNNQKSNLRTKKLFFESVELLNSMPDGEYRTYIFLHNFNEGKLSFEFQQLVFFFLKRGNERAYILHSANILQENVFNRLVDESVTKNRPYILFHKID